MTIPDLGATASATINYLLGVKNTYKKQFELLLLKGLAKIEITSETKIFCRHFNHHELRNKI